jgi:uncharacterized protein (TIGR03437 family)
MKMKIRTRFAAFMALSVACCGLSVAQTTNANSTFSYSGASLPIYYDSTDAATIMSIKVPLVASINSVTATVSINYPTTGDLNVYMFGPDGTRTKLVERNCSNKSTLVNTTFDDAAASKYSDFCPAEAGRTFRGNEPLSNYRGKGTSGTWSLAVENNGSNTAFGTVDAFSLTFNTPVTIPPPTITGLTNAISGAQGSIAPGELIAVSGGNIGPTPGIISSSTTLPTTLGGVQLLINNQAIPLYYVSSTLIAGVVPYQAIPGNPAVIGGQVTVTVSYNNLTSAGWVTNLVSSVPALFTVTNGSTGTTSVKAANQDGTLNSSTNRAAAGSFVTLYASGLGSVQPTGFPAGTPAPNTPLYATVLPSFVNITGQPATVSFSGLAPGTTSVYQVNIQIPAGTPTGLQPILLNNQVGATQSNLGIWIR